MKRNRYNSILRRLKLQPLTFLRVTSLVKVDFGKVYKGVLPNGTEVAVKRLSKTAGQRVQLNWTVRHNIIGGITRGILYLHQDSRLNIIHRDLKPGNILLDADMNPEIADFGTARIFEMGQTEANTIRIVGTLGYMPPEYLTDGQISTKTDIYSFRVLILEIISGKKNSSCYQMNGSVTSVNNIVTYVWRLWGSGSLPELIDISIRNDCKRDEVIRYINVGLLCVQENPAHRPTISKIHQMLTTSSISLPVPRPPGFLLRNGPGSSPYELDLEQGQSTSKPVYLFSA